MKHVCFICYTVHEDIIQYIPTSTLCNCGYAIIIHTLLCFSFPSFHFLQCNPFIYLDISPSVLFFFSSFFWPLHPHSPSPLVFMPHVALVSQGVSEVLVGEEGACHLVDVVVGADGFEVFDVVPEIRGGVGPVGDSWWFIIWY